jgi:hypothetical protein
VPWALTIGRNARPVRARDGSTESDVSNAPILVGCSFARDNPKGEEEEIVDAPGVEKFFERWTVMEIDRRVFLVRDKDDAPEYVGFPVIARECARLRLARNAEEFQRLLHEFEHTRLK